MHKSMEVEHQEKGWTSQERGDDIMMMPGPPIDPNALLGALRHIPDN